MMSKDLILSYREGLRATPIFQGLVKYDKSQLADKIEANFYFFANKMGHKFKELNKLSVVESLTKCCQWELVPDGVQACLIPYGNNLTFQPMYQGLLEVAYRTGIFKAINVNVAYENDYFDFNLGSNCYVNHKPELIRERGKPIAFYAEVILASGGVMLEVMTIKEVNAIRDKAKNNNVWRDYYNAMGKKTVMKQLLKRCPKSEKLVEVIALDNNTEQNFNNSISEVEDTKIDFLNNLLAEEIEKEAEVEAEKTDLKLPLSS